MFFRPIPKQETKTERVLEPGDALLPSSSSSSALARPLFEPDTSENDADDEEDDDDDDDDDADKDDDEDVAAIGVSLKTTPNISLINRRVDIAAIPSCPQRNRDTSSGQSAIIVNKRG